MDFLFLIGDERFGVLDLEFFLVINIRASKVDDGLEMTRRGVDERDREKETREETLTVQEKQKERRKENRKCNASTNNWIPYL